MEPRIGSPGYIVKSPEQLCILLKSYRAGAQLTLRKKRAELSDFVIQVGRSKLAGKMNVDNSRAKSKSTIFGQFWPRKR